MTALVLVVTVGCESSPSGGDAGTTTDAGPTRADAGPPVEGSGCGARIEVATFNIRYDDGSSEDSSDPDRWVNTVSPRRDRAIDLIDVIDPDLLGIQEALRNQVIDLRTALVDHAFHGAGRDDGLMRGEYAGIFYRRERFDLERAGHFWLSETPDTPGTTFPDASNTRMASWVILRDRETGRAFIFMNTHWDHRGESARLRSAALIRERLATVAPDLPAILSGDLNATTESPEIQALLAPAPLETRPLIDGYRVVHEVRDVMEATFHGFSGQTRGWRIDYVLHDEGLRTLDASIVREAPDGVVSDHYPVRGTLAWTRDGTGADCP